MNDNVSRLESSMQKMMAEIQNIKLEVRNATQKFDTSHNQTMFDNSTHYMEDKSWYQVEDEHSLDYVNSFPDQWKLPPIKSGRSFKFKNITHAGLVPKWEGDKAGFFEWRERFKEEVHTVDISASAKLLCLKSTVNCENKYIQSLLKNTTHDPFG